jgi:hypothetical protein
VPTRSTRPVVPPRVKELVHIRHTTRLADDCLRIKCRTSPRAVGLPVAGITWQPASIPAHAGRNCWWVAPGAARYRSPRIVQCCNPLAIALTAAASARRLTIKKAGFSPRSSNRHGAVTLGRANLPEYALRSTSQMFGAIITLLIFHLWSALWRRRAATPSRSS